MGNRRSGSGQQSVVPGFINSKALFLILYSGVLQAKICHMDFIHSLEYDQCLGGGMTLQIKHGGVLL